MTDVYLALDPEANRRVVLKLVEHSRDSYTQLVVEAERRGAIIQQQLHAKDPRILEVFEYGDQSVVESKRHERHEPRAVANTHLLCRYDLTRKRVICLWSDHEPEQQAPEAEFHAYLHPSTPTDFLFMIRPQRLSMSPENGGDKQILLV